MTENISGKSVVVTGAANGVGLAIARLFVSNGANVLLADMDENKLEAEVEALEGREGRAASFAGDLREKLTVNNLMAATIDAFDRVDILVNASRQVLPSDPLKPADDSFETMMHQNATVNLRMCQAVAKRMIAQKEGGAIVNLSSIAAQDCVPESVGYSVASAALDQITRSLAVAYAPYNIRVNAVALGSIMSGSLQALVSEDEDLRDEVIAATPIGRIGEAGEAAQAALFLASPCASFITGQILAVDGGRSLLDRMTKLAY
ncbi:MAG: SDR family oxidoreductase [Rhodobacteraceae bacterium]|nr:SDR family oxidoreductase [Paracoccaceae bacterium]